MNQKQLEKEWKQLIKTEEKFINHSLMKKDNEAFAHS